MAMKKFTVMLTIHEGIQTKVEARTKEEAIKKIHKELDIKGILKIHHSTVYRNYVIVKIEQV